MGMVQSSKGGRSSMVLSEINVTPLVDVMLVLLIIFMVTAPMMQQGLEVQLPETASSGIPVKEDPFILVISSKGKLSIGSVEIPMTGLRKKVKAIFENRRDKLVYIQADTKVDYGVVAKAMAEVKAAGVPNIGLATTPQAF